VPTEQVRLSLRVFEFSTKGKCYGPTGHGYHDSGSVPIGDAPVVWDLKADGHTYLAVRPESETIAHDDPRWSRKCAHCAHVFQQPDDVWQVNQSLYYRRADTGGVLLLEDAPVGAMWYADWYSVVWRGPDGRTLVCRVPGGGDSKHDWIIDARASNCGLPEDAEHRCWVRHGVPPDVTVDKEGKTCAAGAGSIQTPGWHGYLEGGYLVNDRSQSPTFGK
jgi:hypothetical protein